MPVPHKLKVKKQEEFKETGTIRNVCLSQIICPLLIALCLGVFFFLDLDFQADPKTITFLIYLTLAMIMLSAVFVFEGVATLFNLINNKKYKRKPIVEW